MDTSANKELVCMLLQGIANKLPEEHQSLVATAETAIRGKEAPVDEIVEEICSDDEVAIKDGFATFCEFVGISEEDISLDEITAAFQGEMKVVVKAVGMVFECIDKDFKITQNEILEVYKQNAHLAMSDVLSICDHFEKSAIQSDTPFTLEDKKENDRKFEDSIGALGEQMQQIVQYCNKAFPEKLSVKNALEYFLHARKSNVKMMDEKVSLLQGMLEIYGMGVGNYIELELLYMKDFRRTKCTIRTVKEFLQSCFAIGGRNRIYTYTEDPYWIDRPKKIYDVLCSVENQLQGEKVSLLEYKGEER